MNVEKIMSETDDSLRIVKDIFDNTFFHHLLVVESGKLFGVISDRDLFKALSPNIGTAAETAKDTATLNKKVHQIMTRKPIVLESNADIFYAINVFNNVNVSCIPIVDGEQKPIGIVSWRDILKELEVKQAKLTFINCFLRCLFCLKVTFSTINSL